MKRTFCAVKNGKRKQLTTGRKLIGGTEAQAQAMIDGFISF